MKQFLYDKKPIKTISGKGLKVVIFRCVVCEQKIVGMYRLPKKPVDWNDHKDSAWLLLLLKKLKKTFWSTDQKQNLEQEMKLELELLEDNLKTPNLNAVFSP